MKQKVQRELLGIVLEIHKSTKPFLEEEKQSIRSVFLVYFVETLPGWSTKIKSDIMKSDTLATYGCGLYCVLKFLLFHTNIRRGSYIGYYNNYKNYKILLVIIYSNETIFTQQPLPSLYT